MAIEKQSLGAAIKRVRLARGLTQVQLAEAAGLSKGGNSIALIEQGKRFVSVDTLDLLAEALDVPVACLAILGSRKIGTNKAATDFMHSLQKVISAVIAAQESTEPAGNNKQVPTRVAAKKPSNSKPAPRSPVRK